MSNLPKPIKCYEECKLCSLGARSLHRTLYRGQFPTRVLIVGEGPGENEDTLATPLVGPSGQLWWKVLADCLAKVPTSLTVKDFAATNVVACVPWNDDPRTHNRYRQPSLPEMEACRPRLIDTLRLSQPKAIITVGTVAKVQVNKLLKLVWEKKHFPEKLCLSHPAHWARRGGEEGLDAHTAKLALCQFLMRAEQWLNEEPKLLTVAEPTRRKKPNTNRSGRVPKKTGLLTRALTCTKSRRS